MTEEARRLIDALRQIDENDCEYEACGVVIDLNKAADLIESLSAQLDQVTRERDAAVEDLRLWYCFSCNNKSTPYCQECSRNRVRLVKGYLSGRNHYKWRGVKKEVEG